MSRAAQLLAFHHDLVINLRFCEFWKGSSLSAGEPPSFFGKFADQPTRFNRVGKPWFGPSLCQATLNSAKIDPLAGIVEKR